MDMANNRAFCQINQEHALPLRPIVLEKVQFVGDRLKELVGWKPHHVYFKAIVDPLQS